MSEVRYPFIYNNVTVKRVIDGDTIEADLDLGFRIHYTDRFRLIGIDTPERGEPDFDKATEFTHAWCTDNAGKISIWSRIRDKYGRYLAEVNNGEESLNERLLQEGLAKPYGS